MTRWVGLQAVALVIGLASTSFGQMGGGMGGGMIGGGFRGVFQDFGTAGANNPEKTQVFLVKVVSTDDKTSTGTLRLTSAVIGCSFGIYEIKPDKVQEIRFDVNPRMDQFLIGQGGVQRPGAIVTMSGEVIDGTILIPKWWRVETDLGLLTPSPDGLKSIVFVKKMENSPPADDFKLPAPGSSPPLIPNAPIPLPSVLPPSPKS